MRRSYKVALILGILTIVYFAVLPVIFGIMTQRYTVKFVQNENNTLGKVLGFHIDIAKYKRGWFKSTAVFHIEKMVADDSAVVKSIPLIIEHGPFYIQGRSFHLGVGLIKSNSVSLGGNFPYQIDFYDNIGFIGERGTFILLSNKSAQVSNFHVDSLILKMNSGLNANTFNFALSGKKLRYLDPAQSISLNINDFQSSLLAKYVSDRHWQLTFSLGLEKNQLSTIIPGGVTLAPLTINADQVNLSRVHFDTKKMANILADLIQLKQQTDAQQPTKPMAWAALVQQLLTDMIDKDTSMNVAGLSVTTPMGQLDASYNVSFPTLPSSHDYFDLATRDVGSLHIDIPHWLFTNMQANMQFALSNFSYDVFSNTVFARHSEMKLGAFDISAPQSPVKTPTFYASGFSYTGEVTGDPHSLSQKMQWRLARACTANGCFGKIQSELRLSHMNYEAFRGIASATQQLVQHDPTQQTTPMATQWKGLADSYMKLILPTSKVVFSNDMTTPQGELSVHAKVLWPNLKETTNATFVPSEVMNQSQYELYLLFPTAYVDALLQDARTNQLATQNPMGAVTTASETKGPSFEAQVAQFLQYAIHQGYLKRDGTEYEVDLIGKGSVFTVNGKVWQMPVGIPGE